MTPEELDAKIAEIESDALEWGEGLVEQAMLFSALVARIRELEAQRPEVEIVLIDAGGWHVDFNEIPIHWAADETKAREWATQNGLRVRA